MQNLDKFVQRIRMVCHEIVVYKQEADEKENGEYQQQIAEYEKNLVGNMAPEKAAKKKKEEEIFQVDLDPYPVFAVQEFVPDEDGWVLERERAERIHRVVNIYSFLRKTIMPNNLEKLTQNIEKLTQLLDKQKSEGKMPPQWTIEVHDKALLAKLSENGRSYLTQMAEKLQEEEIHVDEQFLWSRFETICEFFNE